MDVLEQIDAILDRATQDFDGRDEILRRAAGEIRFLRQPRRTRVRHANAVGDTLAEMRSAVRSDPVYASGDLVLVWANHGDLIMNAMEPIEEG